jgi:hypothetical protein
MAFAKLPGALGKSQVSFHFINSFHEEYAMARLLSNNPLVEAPERTAEPIQHCTRPSGPPGFLSPFPLPVPVGRTVLSLPGIP